MGRVSEPFGPNPPERLRYIDGPHLSQTLLAVSLTLVYWEVHHD